MPPRYHDLRTCVMAGAALLVLLPLLGFAQSSTPPAGARPEAIGEAPPRSPVPAGADPVVGSVDGKLIYLSDLTRVTNALPEQMRNLPFESIMPVLLDRLIDHQALTMTARRAGLD